MATKFNPALVLIAIIVLGYIALNGNIKLPGQAVVDNCQRTGPYQVSQTGTLECAGGTCSVEATLICDQAASEPAVTLRCSGETTQSNKWFAYDSTGDGNLDYMRSYGSYSPLSSWTKIACCPNGECFGKATISGETKYGYLEGSRFYIFTLAVTPNAVYTNSAPSTAYADREIVGTGSGYLCKWDICPGTYCGKIDSFNSADHKSTVTLTINSGQSLTFRPTYSSGSAVPSSKYSWQYYKDLCCGDDANVCTTDAIVGGECKHTPIANCCVAQSDCSVGYLCTANQCVQDPCANIAQEDLCTSTSSPKCTGTVPKTCNKVSGSSCYKWVTGSDCASTSKICLNGACVSPGTFQVAPASSYQANTEIQVSATLSTVQTGIENSVVSYKILNQQGTEIGYFSGSFTKTSASLYTATGTYTVGLPEGDYQIKASSTIGGTTFSDTKTLKVMSGAQVILYSPQTTFYSHTEGSFLVKVLSASGNPVALCSSGTIGTCFDKLDILVKVGGIIMQATPYYGSEVDPGYSALIKFKQSGGTSINTLGAVYAEVSTSGSNIISTKGTETTWVVKAPTAYIDFYDPDGDLWTSGNIDTAYGVQSFTFKVRDDLGNALNVPANNIQIKVTGNIDYPKTTSCPEGCYNPTPTKVGEVYSFSVDMPENKGDAYFIDMKAPYSNWNPAVLTDIPVRPAGIPKPPIDWTWIIVGGLVGVLVIVLVVVRRR